MNLISRDQHRLGFIAIGHMGRRIAQRLLERVGRKQRGSRTARGGRFYRAIRPGAKPRLMRAR